MTKEFRDFVDKLFEFNWLYTEVISRLNDQDRQIVYEEMQKLHRDFVDKYGKDKRWLQRTSETNNPVQILERISYIPWLADLDPSFGTTSDDIFSAFNTFERKADDLKMFAYDIAKKGYSKDGDGAIDHAGASGAILLQYITYWYCS